jgi:hypothetical protein
MNSMVSFMDNKKKNRKGKHNKNKNKIPFKQRSKENLNQNNESINKSSTSSFQKITNHFRNPLNKMTKYVRNYLVESHHTKNDPDDVITIEDDFEEDIIKTTNKNKMKTPIQEYSKNIPKTPKPTNNIFKPNNTSINDKLSKQQFTPNKPKRDINTSLYKSDSQEIKKYINQQLIIFEKNITNTLKIMLEKTLSETLESKLATTNESETKDMSNTEIYQKLTNDITNTVNDNVNNAVSKISEDLNSTLGLPTAETLEEIKKDGSIGKTTMVYRQKRFLDTDKILNAINGLKQKFSEAITQKPVAEVTNYAEQNPVAEVTKYTEKPTIENTKLNKKKDDFYNIAKSYIEVFKKETVASDKPTDNITDNVIYDQPTETPKPNKNKYNFDDMAGAYLNVFKKVSSDLDERTDNITDNVINNKSTDTPINNNPIVLKQYFDVSDSTTLPEDIQIIDENSLINVPELTNYNFTSEKLNENDLRRLINEHFNIPSKEIKNLKYIPLDLEGKVTADTSQIEIKQAFLASLGIKEQTPTVNVNKYTANVYGRLKEITISAVKPTKTARNPHAWRQENGRQILNGGVMYSMNID